MTYGDLILSEVRLGRNSVRAICLSLPILMKHDVISAIKRLIYAGKLLRLGGGLYKVAPGYEILGGGDAN